MKGKEKSEWKAIRHLQNAKSDTLHGKAAGKTQFQHMNQACELFQNHHD